MRWGLHLFKSVVLMWNSVLTVQWIHVNSKAAWHRYPAASKGIHYIYLIRRHSEVRWLTAGPSHTELLGADQFNNTDMFE